MSALNSTDIFVSISDYSEYSENSDYSEYSDYSDYSENLRIPKSRYFSEK
jgi:hypothetical protein